MAEDEVEDGSDDDYCGDGYEGVEEEDAEYEYGEWNDEDNEEDVAIRLGPKDNKNKNKNLIFIDLLPVGFSGAALTRRDRVCSIKLSQARAW
ncbi:hypothetical protein EJ02DRAFT_426440 [Clathrospora elynae]|uniref:Uncharacterized protein n=1 Tax=Clathrospora elynae TaxID=706981 RepID=A0A6A5SCD8_9PLEO|nr:hypothetical protein EJ02DRAFT_426440 [Clathrospora elynae]